ncbi:zinc ribbon domain-containing protein [bacterium]|jgi:hypothetical protein|nr:zinc ribbon domain-containing protein [bacterium]
MTKEQNKHCPKCKEEIKEDAKKCKHCGADLRNWFVRHKVLSVILGFILLSIIISASGGSDSSTGNDTSPNYYPNMVDKEANVDEQSNKEQLELLNFNCYWQYDYFHIEGQVKNISNKSLESVVAVGTAYTEDGEFVKSDDALIDYNPILAGQTSPFKVMMTHNPAITKCKVDFKEFWGGSIPTKRPVKE